MTAPTLINDIEWFSSTDGLCKALFLLLNKNDQTIKDIISLNVPLIKVGAGTSWAYGGFKGGSEPGVLTFTFLLQNNSKQWYCISFATSNTSVNQIYISIRIL
jgi:hypothetical protein